MTQPPTPPYDARSGERRRRPSGWWFVVGGVLVAVAIGTFLALFVWTLSGFLKTDATVEADGRPHEVTVPTDRDRMMWFDETVTYPDCRVVDLRSGEEIRLRSVSGDFRRNNGTAGDMVGVHQFDPGSGRLEVTCDGVSGRTFVDIGPAPAVGGFVAGLLATILVPLLLGGSGVVVLIVTGVLFATGRPRKE